MFELQLKLLSSSHSGDFSKKIFPTNEMMMTYISVTDVIWY